MSPFDAVFLAAAAAILGERSRAAWLAAIAPFLALVAPLCPLGGFHGIAVALAACAVSPRATVPALLLAAPEYANPWDAVRASALWCASVAMLIGVEDRLEEPSIPPAWRGAPVRLVACAVLYFLLHPLALI